MKLLNNRDCLALGADGAGWGRRAVEVGGLDLWTVLGGGGLLGAARLAAGLNWSEAGLAAVLGLELSRVFETAALARHLM